MRYRYYEWDEDLINRLLAQQDLMRLFNQLLMQTDGDVEEALRWMAHFQERGYIGKDVDLKAFKRKLREEEIIRQDGSRHKLTPRGEKGLRQESLDFIFRNLKSAGSGSHPLNREGQEGPGEQLPEIRPFQYGDSPRDIDFNETWKNAMRRTGLGDLDLQEPDLAIREREAQTSAATVLLLDISHSMVLYGEDRITPAKQVAMALAEMIKTRYPKDSLDIIVFGDEAKRIKLADLPYVGVGPYHTNTQEALRMGREVLLRRKSTNRQIFMITDGKPSVVRERSGELYINSFGLDPYIVNQTLNEAMACRKKGVTITTFMIASDSYLQQFVRRLTELNRGRAYFAPLNRLGGFIFHDFMSNRTRRAH